MNKYKEIQLKIYDWTGNWTKDPCITSQVLYLWAIQVDIQGPSSPNYHIPPPLQSLRPRRLARQTHVHPVRTIKCICLNREGQGTKCCNEEWTNTKKNTKMKIYGCTGNRTRDPCITSQVLYHWAIQTDIHGPSSPNYHIPPPCKVFALEIFWCIT